MLRPLTRWMAFLCLSCALPLSAWGQTFQAGEHYEELPLAVETHSEGVEVVEVFSYACIHCFNFDPIVEHWSANTADDVHFERVPAVFNAVWPPMVGSTALGRSRSRTRVTTSGSIPVGVPASWSRRRGVTGGCPADRA